MEPPNLETKPFPEEGLMSGTMLGKRLCVCLLALAGSSVFLLA